jgi:hypothetical protein
MEIAGRSSGAGDSAELAACGSGRCKRFRFRLGLVPRAAPAREVRGVKPRAAEGQGQDVINLSSRSATVDAQWLLAQLLRSRSTPRRVVPSMGAVSDPGAGRP